MTMQIALSRLDYEFQSKPLLIGGMAMEYYDLRKAGDDIDFIVSDLDHGKLVKQYPKNVIDLYGDTGVCVHNFELWDQICLYRYDFLRQDAIENDEYMVASIDKLILLKAIVMNNPKYMVDLKLLAEYALDVQYKKKALP